MKIGDIIKKYRKEKGLTQKELAEKSNISRSYLADLENNRYNPSLDVLKSISNSLNIPSSVLLCESWDSEYPLMKSQVKEFDLDNNETNSQKYEKKVTSEIKFKTPQEAMEFIACQPSLMNYGGYNIKNMSDEDIIEFANDLVQMFKIISSKYKK